MVCPALSGLPDARPDGRFRRGGQTAENDTAAVSQGRRRSMAAEICRTRGPVYEGKQPEKSQRNAAELRPRAAVTLVCARVVIPHGEHPGRRARAARPPRAAECEP